MEDRVLEYIDDIANYAARPTLAMYAASRLAKDILEGRIEDWRSVWKEVIPEDGAVLNAAQISFVRYINKSDVDLDLERHAKRAEED